MAREARTPRPPRGAPVARRSHAGRIVAAAIGVASAAGLGVGLTNTGAPNPAATSPVRLVAR